MAGVIDENGKEVLSCTYDSASYDFYGNGYSGAKSAIFEKDGKSIVYNLIDGTMVTRKYSNYKGLLNGYTRVEQNGKFGVVDSKDNLIVPIKYSQITEAITSDNGHLDDGFHVWDADGRVGVVKVINGKGKEIVPCAGNYDRIWGYESYGVIVVKNGKQGCIKENGATFCRPVLTAISMD